MAESLPDDIVQELKENFQEVSNIKQPFSYLT